MGADFSDLYKGFIEPLFSYPVTVLFVFMSLPLSIFVGFRLGIFERKKLEYDKYPSHKIPGGTSVGALLALLGLLLGFSFNSSINWREARQSALVEEAAAIGSAFLSADLLPDKSRKELQNVVLNYAKTRIAAPEDVATRAAFSAFLERTRTAQARVWPATLDALNSSVSDPIRVFVARNVLAMLDAHSRRIAAGAEHLPKPATLMIISASVVALFIVGNTAALQGRALTWRTLSLAAVLSLVMLIIFDLDRSQEGTMRLNVDPLIEVIHDMDSALSG